MDEEKRKQLIINNLRAVADRIESGDREITSWEESGMGMVQSIKVTTLVVIKIKTAHTDD